MPRPRAPSRDFFECTNRRRAGGKCDLYRCKCCGREMLENTHRFAIHVSICKKASDEERKVALAQLRKTKKYSPKFNRQPLPSALLWRDVVVGNNSSNNNNKNSYNNKNKSPLMLMRMPRKQQQQQQIQRQEQQPAPVVDNNGAELLFTEQNGRQHEWFASREQALLAFQCLSPHNQPDWEMNSSSTTTHQHHYPHQQHQQQAVSQLTGIDSTTLEAEYLLTPLSISTTQQQCHQPSEQTNLFILSAAQTMNSLSYFGGGSSYQNMTTPNHTADITAMFSQHLASNECFTDVEQASTDSFIDPFMMTSYPPSSATAVVGADAFYISMMNNPDNGGGDDLGFHSKQHQQDMTCSRRASSVVPTSVTMTNPTFVVHGYSNNGAGDAQQLAHHDDFVCQQQNHYQSPQSHSSSSSSYQKHCYYAWDASSMF